MLFLQQAKNALHGVWLGHPLHPVFTDLPIGAWTTALALDVSANGDPGMRRLVAQNVPRQMFETDVAYLDANWSALQRAL